MALLHIVLFTALFATSFADIAHFEPCSGDQDLCEVTEVRINPCKKPTQCVLKKRSNASISFDFTPKFAADTLTTAVYWENGATDLPFKGFGSSDGCRYTTCPTEANKSQTFSYGLYLSKKLGEGIFPVKWTLMNSYVNSDGTTTERGCCFRVKLQIKK